MSAADAYDLVVIGGGAAGISAAAAGAGLGARTLLVERDGRLGGECSWTGCVPSKALLHTAHVVRLLRLHGADSRADELAARAMAETRELTARIARDTASQAFLEQLGCEVVYHPGEIVGPHSVRVGERVVGARRVILATGSLPAVPEVPGLASAGFLTNQNLFDLEAPPRSLAVIGAGPVGLEMALAFRRLGSEVTVITRGPRILSRDDGELTEMLAERLADEGIRIEREVTLTRVERVDWRRRVIGTRSGATVTVEADELLVATGRRANVAGLGLETVDLAADPNGVAHDRYQRTPQRWLLAAGDVLGHHHFSHVAEEEARTAVRNAFFPVRGRTNYRWAPWCTFTSPELAHLGETEEQLRARGARYRVYRWSFEDDDRARVDREATGCVKLLATPAGRLLGAHVLGPRAGEVTNELVLAVRKGARIADLALTVHIYPTLGLTPQRAADHWFEDLMRVPWIRRAVTRFTRRV